MLRTLRPFMRSRERRSAGASPPASSAADSRFYFEPNYLPFATDAADRHHDPRPVAPAASGNASASRACASSSASCRAGRRESGVHSHASRVHAPRGDRRLRRRIPIAVVATPLGVDPRFFPRAAEATAETLRPLDLVARPLLPRRRHARAAQEPPDDARRPRAAAAARARGVSAGRRRDARLADRQPSRSGSNQARCARRRAPAGPRRRRRAAAALCRRDDALLSVDLRRLRPAARSRRWRAAFRSSRRDRASLPEVVGDAGILARAARRRRRSRAAMRRIVDDARLPPTSRRAASRAPKSFTWARCAELTMRAWEECRATGDECRDASRDHASRGRPRLARHVARRRERAGRDRRGSIPDADLFALVDFLPDEARGRSRRQARDDVIPAAPARRAQAFPHACCRFFRARSNRSICRRVRSRDLELARGRQGRAHARPRRLHVCYCHTPMRYAWDLREQYLGPLGLATGLRGALARRMLDRLRDWDRREQRSRRRISSPTRAYIRERIERCYGRDATVIYPPVDVDFFTPAATPSPVRRVTTTSRRRAGCRTSGGPHCGRLSRHAGTAARRRRRRPGSGARARAAGPNVEFVGEVSRERLRDCVARRARLRFRRRGGFRDSSGRGAGLRHAGDRVRPRRQPGDGARDRRGAADRHVLRCADSRGHRRRRARLRRTRCRRSASPRAGQRRAILGGALSRGIAAFVAGAIASAVGANAAARRSSPVRASAQTFANHRASFIIGGHGPQRPQAPRDALPRHPAPRRSRADRSSSGSSRTGSISANGWPPEHYLLFLGAGAVTIAALFPLFSLYDPQRGVSLTEELRRLMLAWGMLAALAGGAIFATKMGDAFSRVWVSAWLGGGFVATAATARVGAPRAAQPAPARAQSAAHRDRRRRHARDGRSRSACATRPGRASTSSRSTTTTRRSTAPRSPARASRVRPTRRRTT